MRSPHAVLLTSCCAWLRRERLLPADDQLRIGSSPGQFGPDRLCGVGAAIVQESDQGLLRTPTPARWIRISYQTHRCVYRVLIDPDAAPGVRSKWAGQ